ncbi:MAG: helix-turn-helix domain-containing protein [Nocardiopsaceae bacterium]|nr:helix-turn-helix domain-containing protein [Nocardiopsaceae bacterium]
MSLSEVVYRRYPPSLEQAGFIEHLWTVQAPGWPEPRREILIPNGRPSVVVNLAEPGARHDPLTGRSQVNGDTVFGITTRPHVLEQSGPSAYVGAQLRPWGLAVLLGTERLVDEVRPLHDCFGGRAAAELIGVLAGRGCGEAGARALEAFLVRHAAPLSARTEEVLCRAVTAVDTSRGTLGAGELAHHAEVSADRLYRLFKSHLGVGPKKFSELTRYYHFVGGLLSDARDSAALLAQLHGYYDQAHAAHDFKRYTGVSARSFQRLHNGIARLMHAPFLQAR